MTHRSRPGEPVAKKASTWVNPEANHQRPNATGRFLGAQVLRYAPWLRGVGIVRASFSGRARSPREPAGLRQVSEPHRLGTMMESYGNLRELSNGLVEPKRRVPPLPLSEPVTRLICLLAALGVPRGRGGSPPEWAGGPPSIAWEHRRAVSGPSAYSGRRSGLLRPRAVRAGNSRSRPRSR
jgi:hypothetical protein